MFSPQWQNVVPYHDLKSQCKKLGMFNSNLFLIKLRIYAVHKIGRAHV